MKNAAKSFTLLAVILTLSSPLAWAQPVKDMGPRQPGERMPPHEFAGGNPRENIIEQLDLSDEQNEKLKEHKFKYDIMNVETANKIDVLRRKLQYELTKKTMDKAAINTIVEETNQQQVILLKNHVDSIVALREILTYEQFEKLEGAHQRPGGIRPKKLEESKGATDLSPHP
ncbi:MAG: hypothetical protein A2Z81_06335 [Omnitrophica WOR_2 bacterium GWA2_45_18]|nr:MAG: hypothetical protein A2Z81_06335 [Omnitrophica WOR_2 bacterium GWA2_45_18]